VQSAFAVQLVLHAEPSALHAYAAHAVAQQTPDTQWAPVHCASVAHAEPLGFCGAQVPPAQYEPDVQSPSTAHDVLHAVAEAQANPPGQGAGARHEPLLLQIARALPVQPLPHEVPTAG
jgi:hypothetical protein